MSMPEKLMFRHGRYLLMVCCLPLLLGWKCVSYDLGQEKSWPVFYGF